ncbi:MAG: hypothetical protein K6E70_02790 [Butyrivibrio sp.]|nr:hypothetical protein [Butyrivibrio sp.]
MTDAKTLIETINRYNQISMILLAMAVVLMVLSVILWHRLNIRNSLRVLTGMGAGRAVAKLRADTERDGIHQTENFDKVSPVITWSSLSGQMVPQPAPQIQPEEARPVEQRDTASGMNFNINKNPASVVFVVEQDIVYTAISNVNYAQ